MYNDSFWEKNFIRYQTKSWINKPSIFSQEVFKYIEGKNDLLELGGGLGQDSRYFSSKGLTVTCADSSEYALKIAKEKSDKNIKFIKLDLSETLPFNNKSFDVVYAHLSLHYFDDNYTRELIKDIHRILRPNGIFLALFNTIEDPEILTDDFVKIEENYYQEIGGIKKRYFSTSYINTITKNLFKLLLSDNRGKTHKDEIDTLIRYVGKKI